MKQGNWVPISKACIKFLPRDREYTELEAMFSLTVDYDNSSPASVSGYASLWGWSRKRVSNFMNKYGVVITYEEKFNRHKKGEIGKKLGVPYGEQEGNRRGTGKAQVEFIDSKELQESRNRKGTGGEQEGSRKGSTTTEPNPKPKEKNTSSSEPDEDVYKSKKGKVLRGKRLEDFYAFWNAFDYKTGKAEAADAWANVYTPKIADSIIAGAKREARRRPSLLRENKTPKMAQGWLNGRRWEDEIQVHQEFDCPNCHHLKKGYCKGDKEQCQSYSPIQQ